VQAKGNAEIPWGSVAALLTACFATIAGLIRGLDPEVILWRAVVSATLVGSLTAVVCGVTQWVRNQASKK
jgi:hypothetical protein